MTKSIQGNEPHDKQACDAGVTRKEFLTTLVRRATMAGALLAAPKIIDKFLVPPVYAATSTTHINDTTTSSDTNQFHDITNSHHDSTGSSDVSPTGAPHNAPQHDEFG